MDKSLLARIESQGWVHRYPRVGPMVLFLLTALATLLSVVALERAEGVRHSMDLENYATEVAANVERRAAAQIAILHATSAVFALRGPVTREEFASFGASLRDSGAFQAPLVLSWVERVPIHDLAAFEHRIRQSGQASFKVFPAPLAGRHAVFPIIYIDSLREANRRYIGYDLYSLPVLREAMARAAQIGEPVATARLEVAERGTAATTPGLAIFMPVYKRSEVEKSLTGFTYSTIQASDLLGELSGPYRGADKQISLYDETRSPANLLARSGASGRMGPPIERELKIANRKWILVVAMRQQAVLSDIGHATLLFGLAISCLVMVMARLITRRASEDRALLDWYTRQAAIRTSLSRELSHRVKNTLANVLSIVALTRRRASNIDEFAESLTGRLRALSATQDLLSLSDWREAGVEELLREELAPYIDEDEPRILLEGPEVSLAPNDALSLGLAIHELATNAAKYGALSVPGGTVRVLWHLETPDTVLVAWREQGGPPVSAPTRRGFGIELIEKIVSQELNAKVELQFLPTGVECKLRVPVRKRSDFALRSQYA